MNAHYLCLADAARRNFGRHVLASIHPHGPPRANPVPVDPMRERAGGIAGDFDGDAWPLALKRRAEPFNHDLDEPRRP